MWSSPRGEVLTTLDRARPALLVVLLLTSLGAARSSHAQPTPRTPRVGILGDTSGPQWTAFRDGMRERGWIEGQSLELAWRWSEGTTDRLPALAAELVQLKVDVIVTEGGPATRAAKKATATIPIVMTIVADPVGTGLVASLARPGGNVTGSSSPSPQLTAKQIELLKEAVPRLSRLSVLWNPTSPAHPVALKEIEAAAAALRVSVQRVEARTAEELESAFAAITQQRPHGLLVLATPIFDAQQRRIADFAARSRLPAVFNKPLFAEAGGLMAYGARYADFFRHAATYVDKILNGAKPADLPVEQPARFELIINLRTAKALGLTIPPSLLLRADRVIE